jgi:hypothetical protein
MHLATIVSFFFSALSVLAQTAEDTAAINELLAELTQLPTCAVRNPTKVEFFQYGAELTMATDYLCHIIAPDLAVLNW